MYQFQDLPPSVGFTYDATWPRDYGGVPELENSLQSLQNSTLEWKNISREDCTTIYNQVSYSQYRTLVMVTNYTSPDFNNSALAIGVLPGYRSNSVGASLLALCPDAYLETYKGASRPVNAVYIPTPLDSSDHYLVSYIDPSKTESKVSHATGSSRLKSRQIITTVMGFQSFNPLPETEICYSYWPANDTTNINANTLLYTQPRVPFEYCLAEPVSSPPTCPLVYSPLLVLIITIILFIKSAALLIAVYLRFRYTAFYGWLDVKEYYHDSHEGKDAYIATQNWQTFRPRIKMGNILYQVLLYIMVFVWTWLLWAASSGKIMKQRFRPTSTR